MGAGVPSNEEKSIRSRWAIGKGWGLFVATVGEDGPSSERVEETDRRFVRAGVRTGWVGGCFCELEEWDLWMGGGGGVELRRF
jgi:hypothetical protein